MTLHTHTDCLKLVAFSPHPSLQGTPDVIFEQNHTVSGFRVHIDVSLYRFVYTIDTMDDRDTLLWTIEIRH